MSLRHQNEPNERGWWWRRIPILSHMNAKLAMKDSASFCSFAFEIKLMHFGDQAVFNVKKEERLSFLIQSCANPSRGVLHQCFDSRVSTIHTV